MSDRAVMPLADYDSACDNIREKTETTEAIKSGELPEKINDVYEAGQAQGEREIWDALTNYNNRTDYEKTFSDSGYEYIRPPYKIYPKYKRSGSQTFCEARNLKKIEAKYFDFSQKTQGTSSSEGYYFTFYSCNALEEIEDVGIQPDYGYYNTFNCQKLKKIAVIRSDENTRYSETFDFDYALEYVRFEGVIGQNGLNFRWSKKLTYDSCHSIFTHLKDFRTVMCKKLSVLSNPITVAEGTLNVGEAYTLTFESDEYGIEVFTGIVSDSVYVLPIGENKKGMEFVLQSYGGGEVAMAWVYQDGNEIKFTIYCDRTNKKISLVKAPTETRTITMPTTVRDNGNATPEDIAEATERGWTIVWS